VPFGEIALFHGGRKRGHQDLNRHRGITALAIQREPARPQSPAT
jgi:hypothetical protein